VVAIARSLRASTLDVALALAAAAGSIAGTVIVSGDARTQLDLLGYGLLIATAAPLLVRRRHPAIAFVATATIAFAYDALDYPAAFYTLAILIALYTVAEAGGRWQALVGAVAVVIAFALVDVLFQRGHVMGWSGGLWFAGWLLLSIVLAEFAKGRRAYLDQVEQRALEAERTREEEARRRAGEERMRIARELHDVVAHSIALINVQASAALHVLDKRPNEVRSALLAIDQASRDALDELRATLGVLRGADEEGSRAPTPTLARLDELVASATAAGVHVQLDVRGEPRPLPRNVDLAAYRIVQESLTNVVRHAKAAAAELSITYAPRELVIEVADEGTGVAPGWSRQVGNGILGMRERAAAAGGELEAGPRPEGGFRVRARLSLRGTS
jgi:signal transduction histidine kinase